ncbi:hypothetical protein MKEN_01458700 [Mycena kentingensis (nom. inval.)]|nr:hypothetical protein MKEN_01458700 [Mycena kentingensis (nom. inval.)]
MEHPGVLPVRYETKVAEEVWDICWSFASCEDLKQLSLVCSRFRRICQHQLFHALSFPPDSLAFQGGKFRDGDLALLALFRTAQRDFAALTTGSLASSTKECELGVFSTGLRPDTVFLALPDFSTLRSLTLCCIHVTLEVREAIGAVAHLDDLILSHCDGDDLGEALPLVLKKLAIITSNYQDCRSLLSMVSPGPLREFSISIDANKPRALTSRAFSWGRLSSLSSLIFTQDRKHPGPHGAHAALFALFISRCDPAMLENVHPECRDSGGERPELAQSWLPAQCKAMVLARLTSFTGPCEAACVLAAVQSLEEVHLFAQVIGRYQAADSSQFASAIVAFATAGASTRIRRLTLCPRLVSDREDFLPVFQAVSQLRALEELSVQMVPTDFEYDSELPHAEGHLSDLAAWCRAAEGPDSDPHNTLTIAQYISALVHSGTVMLPPTLHKLDIQSNANICGEYSLNVEHQRTSVAALSTRFPSLEEISFYEECGQWVRDGDFWSSELVDEKGKFCGWAPQVRVTK